MPFGAVFAALFFGVVCPWVGVRLLMQPGTSMKGTGLFLAVLGLSLALGLLRKQTWSRWIGLVGAGVMAFLASIGVAAGGEVTTLLLLFSSGVAGLLLALPATGGVPRSENGEPVAAPSRGRWLPLAACLGLCGLVASAWWTTASTPRTNVPEGALPASAIGRNIRWNHFAEGMALARAEDKLVLATFVTDWCPYCTKMQRETWTAPSVVERVSGLVAVRVDAEETRQRGGFSGQELGMHYEVQGFPAQLLLDSEGRVMGRADGFQTARQLLDWLDGVSPRSAPTRAAPALESSNR